MSVAECTSELSPLHAQLLLSTSSGNQFNIYIMNKKSVIITILFALVAFVDTKFDVIESLGLTEAAENSIKAAGAILGFVMVSVFGKPDSEENE
jgi:hypothetical protein